MKKKKKTYKKIMIKNEWREEASQWIYHAIVIIGYKLKHISTRYTDGVFAMDFKKIIEYAIFFLNYI